ncbi:uncharacterized protein ppp1r3ab [Lycodopsis pacificus]
MEFVGQPGPSGACNLLGVPGLSPLEVDDDECEVVIGIRPKSSPRPRRRSSDSDEDSEPGPPMSASRRVSFADVKGLSLVHVKEFDTWDVPKLPQCDSSVGEGTDAEVYFLSPLTFSLPLSTEELFVRVREQKIELETIELLPGTTILKGVIRVLNISFNKAVYVRTTLDTWSSHFDLLAEYMPGTSDSLTDRFSFKLTLVRPFGEQGARVEFCLRYETSVGTFWANNNDRNYVLFCHRRMKERKETPQKERLNKKSCLKTVSQSFSTEENIFAAEASSQENISTDVSKHGEIADTVKAEQISDGQSGTSEEDRQKLLTESRRNSSQRSCRKAARMLRVRDYFSQRDGGADESERDESPPEANQAAQEETPEQSHPDVQSFPEGSSKSGGSPFVSESLETCSEPLIDVPHDTSPSHDHTSDSETEKSESVNLADSATLTGGERAAVIPDNPSNDEPASAECQNINKSVSKAEESSQRQGTSHECVGNIAAQPADSDISEGSSESLDSQTNSFTFGTVVAPLYHQLFGRVGHESDWGNPVHAGDLRYPHTERRQTSCTGKTDARGNEGEVQGHVMKSPHSNQGCLVTNSPAMGKEETSLSVTANNIPDKTATLRDTDDITRSDQRRTNTSEVPKTISGDTVVHSHTANILNTDSLNPQKPAESLHLQGEAQEDNLTHDPKLREHTCTQTKTSLHETAADSEPREVMSSFMSLQPSKSVSGRVSDETDQQTSGRGADDCKLVRESNKEETVTISTTTAVSEEDKGFEAFHDFNPEHMNNSASEETEISYVTCFEIVEEKDVTAPEISLETINVEEGNKVENNSPKDKRKHSAEEEIIGEVAEAAAKATMNTHMHGDMCVELKDEDPQNREHHEIEASVAKQEDLCLADATEVNWEMMVEEEEQNILTDEEESEAIRLKTVGKDQGQLEDAGRETALENKDATEAEKEETMVWDIKAAREEKNKAEDADVSEGKQKIGVEIGEMMAGEVGDEVEKELEHVQDTNEAGEEDVAEEIEEEKREKQEETELEKAKHFAEIHDVDTEKTNVQNEEDIEGEEEIEIDLSDDDEAGVEWEDQVQPREVDVEEENPDYEEDIVVVETGESEIIDAESESVTIEDGQNEAGCIEVRLDITQKLGYGLSAPVNNVQDKGVIDGENGHIPTEMQLYKEEDSQSKEAVTHDPTRAAGDENEAAAADGGSFIFTDEPANDQTSHDSASAESDSDDEVELYMHCLRAVHTGAQAQTDGNKDTGFGEGKLRPSVSRGKLLPAPLPSISESQDEEQHPGRRLDTHEDVETADVQPTALPASSGQESIDTSVSWWKETFSCSNISKTLLYATLLVVFFVVAYRYDFLACLGLYLISVVWLYCQGERQPKQQKKQQNRLN